MNDEKDPQLLRSYTESRSESAFAELVRRHIDFVYSAALRMISDSHLAEDVTQQVFVAFAKNAAELTNCPGLSGWLHRTAQNIAAQTVRTIERRRAREQEVAVMNQLLSADPDVVWDHIAPYLDEALAELPDDDRDALLLRYFERKSAREMAQTLGTSEDAAQKRVSRAVERLREFFAKHGHVVGTSGLVAVISTNAVQAAPVGLAATIITAAALTGATLATATITTTTKAIAMTTLQKSLTAATIVAAVGTGIYEARQASEMRNQVQIVRQQQTPLAEQNQHLQQEQGRATRELAALREENERLNRNTGELLRLRGEVSLLRRSQSTPAKSADSAPSSVAVTTSQDQASAEIGRELGLAVVRGDPGALDKLTELSTMAHESFHKNNVGLDDTQRSELSTRTFAPIRAAFDVIGEAATKGNQVAIDAVMRAIRIVYLRGMAVEVVGKLAGSGDERALEMLLNPQKYDILLSSSVGALGFAAYTGNQRAIDALFAVTQNENNKPLWFMAAEGLSKAAESGNPVAVDALVSLSSSTNTSVRGAVVSGLKRAAANQNAKAIETLHSMGVE